MNTKAAYKLSYGVYLLSAREGEKDNACIINTAVQVANNPTRISVSVIKGNLTHDMIVKTGKCNLSAISEDAPYALFERFGMQSGRTANKFEGFENVRRSENGLYYLTAWANAFLSLNVREAHDLGSHTLFIAELADGEVLSDAASCTYAYYQSTIKSAATKPQAAAGPVKKWVCSVCGYVHEGENPPETCPLCHVPASKFVEEKPQVAVPAKKWVCTVCGYIHEGENPPETCPLCRVPASRFVEQK